MVNKTKFIDAGEIISVQFGGTGRLDRWVQVVITLSLGTKETP